MVRIKNVSEASSSCSPSNDKKYDVFLCFRGEDTRLTFTSHLLKALKDANLKTFLDDEEIDTGLSLKSELESAIRASRASVIVLSKNFASSRWCLNELALILEQHRDFDHIVIPIFYHVEATDVRNQQNSFGDAMEDYKKKMAAETNAEKKCEWAQKIEIWKNALTQVADLKGKNPKDRAETVFIEEIVKEIYRRLGVPLNTTLPLLIGMDDNNKLITSWLKDGSSHTADILTILGMGGIGKTMTITALSDINGTNGKCIIKVKVVFIWNQYYGATQQSKVADIDMILMDEQGTKIHATIDNLVVSYFDNLIHQDDYHVISNFNVKNNTDMLKLTSHACKIYFLKKTNVRRCSDFADIQEPLNFMSFESFLERKIDPKCSFDVIGQLVENNNITIMDPDDKPKHLLEFKLQDLCGVRIPCTLWKDLAVKLHNFIKANATSKDPIILLIIMAKQSKWNYVTQVSNCFAGTRLVINDEENPHIKEFKKKLLSSDIATSGDTKVLLSTETVVKQPVEFYLQFSFKNIEEVYDINQPSGCVVVGKILKIVSDQGWYYMTCTVCKSIVKTFGNTENGRNYCAGCGTQTKIYPSIKVQIRVQDDTCSAILSLFQQDVCKLTGKSQAYLMSKIDKDVPVTTYPEDLDIMVGKVCAFKLQISNYNLNNNYPVFTVNKLTEDEAIIKELASKQQEEEVQEEVETPASIEEEVETPASVGGKRKNKATPKRAAKKTAKIEQDDS